MMLVVVICLGVLLGLYICGGFLYLGVVFGVWVLLIAGWVICLVDYLLFVCVSLFSVIWLLLLVWVLWDFVLLGCCNFCFYVLYAALCVFYLWIVRCFVVFGDFAYLMLLLLFLGLIYHFCDFVVGL